MDTTTGDSYNVERQTIISLNEGTVIQPSPTTDIWFEDGNVVLQAEYAQFRVHRSILSTHSMIFRDMFAIPQPTSKNKLEECPIVRLSDSAEDWTHVLRALYDRSYQFDDDEPQSFSVVAAFARLGTKYEFRQLRTEAVKRLTFEFPSQLNRLETQHSGTRIIGANGLVFRAITLARETNMLFVLPCAMAICCQSYTIRDILNGVGSPDYPHMVLSTEDQRACLSGWYDLIHMQAKETFKWLDPHMRDTLFPDCVSRARCTKARARILYSMSHPISLCNPFSRFVWEMVMCINCTIVSKVQHENGRKNIWNDLPSFFGLPGWDELLKE